MTTATDAKDVRISGSQRIRDAWEQLEESCASKPPQTGTSVTMVRMGDGLTCEVEQGPWPPHAVTRSIKTPPTQLVTVMF